MRLFLMAAFAIALVPSAAHASPAGHRSTAAPAAEISDTDHYSTATSLTNDTERKSVTVTCPADQIVYGFGGATVGSDGQVALTAIAPNEELTSVTAVAQARGGWAGAWSVMAVASCWPPGNHALQRVVTAGTFNGARAECPGQKILYSDGYRVSSRTGTPFVDAVVPAPDQSSVFVHGGGVPAADLTVEAVALCGYRIDGPYFYFRARTQTTVPVSAATTTTAIAPLPQYTFGQPWIFGAGATSTRAGMFIDALGPGPGLTGGLARMSNGSTAAAKNMAAGATQDDDSMTTYGICIGTWY